MALKSDDSSETVLFAKFLALLVVAANLIIISIVLANIFVDSYTFSEERYQLETERLKLQQKLCTPENLITEEGNS